MSLTMKRVRAYSSGEALEKHANNAHEGEILPDCPACQELLDKKEKFQKVENVSEPKPVGKGYYALLNKGRNPSGYCTRGNHIRCLGRHARNHGTIGERCSCECHLTEGVE